MTNSKKITDHDYRRYPLPSNGTNGTIITPRPTYTDIPFNMGQTVGAGKTSIAAIIVALAFALFT